MECAGIHVSYFQDAAASIIWCIYLSLFLVHVCHGSANVYTDQTYIKDEAGRVRLYHGVNIVNKGYAWYSPGLLDPVFVANMSKLGLNFVRLGMMWSGVEPEPGKFNYTYINIMKTIVELLESNQIFVLLDMHQNVLSSRSGGYDGIPAWLYDRFPPPTHPFPWPLKKVDNWSLGYVTEACSHGFQCLYDNVADAIDLMGNFWRFVASSFSSYSNLLGYEFINEPWAGNYLVDPFILLPGIAGAKNLQPMYDRLSNFIRSVDNKTLIFYEPVTWGVRLNGNSTGTRFTHVPGGDEYRNRSVLSYHYYCTIIQIVPVPGNATIPVVDRVLCDDVEGPALFRSALVDAKQLGGALFLTEFGGCDNSATCIQQIEWAMENADRYFQSWVYWADDFYTDLSKSQRLSRPYARAVAGTPITMRYDTETRFFVFIYDIDVSIRKPTEIYLSPLVYPEASYNITLDGHIKWRVDSTNPNFILVEPTEQNGRLQRRNTMVTVSIRPKDQ